MKIHNSFENRTDYAYANEWPWPSQRFRHTSVLNPIDNELIIFGGFSGKCVDYCNDLWRLNLLAINDSKNAWTQVIKPNSTAPNDDPATAGERWHHHSWFSHDATNNHSYLYIYGGHRHQQFLDDLLQFDLTTQTWRVVNNTVFNNNTNQTEYQETPPTRMASAFAVATDLNNTNYCQNRIYVHGGYHAPNRLYSNYSGLFPKWQTYWLRDLWYIDIDDTTNVNVPRVKYSNLSFSALIEIDPIPDEILTELNRWYAIPFPRSNHKLFYCSKDYLNLNLNASSGGVTDDLILLFGGYISHQFMNDMWRFNLTSQRWTRHYPPKIWNIDTSSYYINHEMFNITNTTMHGFTIDQLLSLANKTGRATNITSIYKLVTQSYEIYAIDSNITKENYIMEPRSDFDITYVPSLNSLILFGGVGSDRTYFDYDKGYDTHHVYFNDTWIMRFDECLGPTLDSVSDPCNKANNQGRCMLQYCFCESGYWGNACQNIMCPSSSCTYDEHTWLPTCQFCSNNGICDASGTCHCVDGYKGNGCEQLDCLNDCVDQDHGICTELAYGNVQCVCNNTNAFNGYGGDDCSDIKCPRDCFGRGTCDLNTGTCTCNPANEAGRKYKLPDCAITILESGGNMIKSNTMFVCELGVVTLILYLI